MAREKRKWSRRNVEKFIWVSERNLGEEREPARNRMEEQGKKARGGSREDRSGVQVGNDPLR